MICNVKDTSPSTPSLSPCMFLVLPTCLYEYRRRVASNKGNAEESVNKVSKESKAVPAPDANAELRSSIEVLHFID